MPDYLVLDEPVDGLDPVMRRQVWSLVLGDVAQRGTTVLVSSHNLRELETCATTWASWTTAGCCWSGPWPSCRTTW